MSLGSGASVDGGSNGGAGGNNSQAGNSAQGGGNGAGAVPGSSGASSGSAPGSSPGAAAQGGSPGGQAPSGGSNLGNGGQGAASSWREGLPDDIKADPTLGKYSDVTNLAKAHIELQKKIGQKGIFKPGEGASKEEINAFREAMGIPTDISKYDLGKFEGVEVDASIVDWAKEQGLRRGIDPSEMRGIITDYMKLDAANEATQENLIKEDIKEGYVGLRKEWGDAFDRNLGRADMAAKAAPNGAAFIDRMKEYGADNDPEVLKYCSWVATLLGEDKLREAGVSNDRSTPQELDNEIAMTQSRMLASKPGTPEHKVLVDKFASLYRQKTGGR
jgi:hypothetical protein